VAVTSRINEQIAMLGVEMGQRVHKGQVVVRLDRTSTEDKIMKGRAELERAEYQYQNILMGQGYKRGAFDQAPESIRELARVNSGYNTAKAALRQMEHQLSYCTIQAPISGVVTQLDAVLYATAVPGETLFRIVDTDHLKVCFDILENELQRFGKGTVITVTPISYPDDRHQARITAVSPVVEKSGMIHLEAALTPHPHLMPGMSAIVTLGSEDN
jgi:RND family efflux transporter MFP subunit